jgi:hypothetical protein
MCSFFNSNAQLKKDIQSTEWWNNITIASETELPMMSDTVVVMYTTRKLNKTNIAFFTNEISATPTVALAVCKNKKWKVYILPTLIEALHYLPLRENTVFYVEGLGKSFPIAMYRAAGVMTQYQVNVIMFDYPSLDEQKGLIKNFYFAQRNSIQSAPQFASFLNQVHQLSLESSKVEAYYSSHKVLLMHSLGNAMLREMMLKKIDLAPHILFNRIIINAACVPQRKHSDWVNEINFANEIYIHYNKKDFQLLGATFLKHQKVLGARNTKPYSQKATYVNFYKLLGPMHNGYLNNPGVFNVPLKSDQFYRALFYGEPINWNDDTQFKKMKSRPHHYLILP